MRTIVLYGLSLGVLILLLKIFEYKFLVHDFSLEFYLGGMAIVFTIVGIWTGLRITRRKTIVLKSAPSDFVVDEAQLERLGISKRELEVLELMASGLTNQEIADKLFLSANTVKTHLANLFIKLDARRRTQAVQKAKSLRLIP